MTGAGPESSISGEGRFTATAASVESHTSVSGTFARASAIARGRGTPSSAARRTATTVPASAMSYRRGTAPMRCGSGKS